MDDLNNLIVAIISQYMHKSSYCIPKNLQLYISIKLKKIKFMCNNKK